MKKKLLEALNASLQLIEQGEKLETILVLFPTLADELRPLLETTLAARDLGQFNLPPEESIALGRSKFLTKAEQKNFRKTKDIPIRKKGMVISWKMAFAVSILMTFLILSTNSVLAAATYSIPGDPLYPLKRLVENIQLVMTFNPAEKIALEAEFNQRRVDEVLMLIETGRSENIDFKGIVEFQGSTQWIISELSVEIIPATQIDETIVVGDYVCVAGETSSYDGIQAIAIVNCSRNESGIQVVDAFSTDAITEFNQPNIVVSATVTPTPTVIATNTATVMPTSTATATFTATVTPELDDEELVTNTPRPTKTPKPTKVKP